MKYMQHWALCVALAVGGMGIFSSSAQAQVNNTTIKGVVYQPNGMIQKNPRIYVKAYDSNNVLINSTLSNATSGAFTLTDLYTHPDPLNLRIKLEFVRANDSKIVRTITVLLGPSITTVIDVTCPVP